VSLLEISDEAGDSGPVVVLAGEADHSSITQLNEVLTAQVSARTSHLTIDVTNLRSADPATAQALLLAALIVRVQGGNPVLLNPQPLVARHWTICAQRRRSRSWAGHPLRTNRLPAPALVERRGQGQ
jgi:anti-anti-sigma factor